MYTVVVKPGESFGPINLGMTFEEVSKIFKYLPYSDSFIHLNYDDDGKLNELEVANDRFIRPMLEEYDIYLFQTKVEELIPRLNPICSYAQNELYVEGCQYDYTELGIRLWRNDDFYEKDLKDTKFSNLSADEFSYWYDKLYFESLVIYKDDK
ncbi:hypothetical protein [Paenibacillus sp. Marseille-Q4541]|uniref:hypothetical protein n=1 Tax=Paenibacillus sp. Marseille-Q4541 TaxID=2831522 RepID=UPI001BA5BC75|nr:hypothetical protein [Paenibacillus sp. Marseille-Q4541]